MSTEYADATFAQIREVISRLQSPVTELPTLLQLLTAPLACIKLLPPQFEKYNTSPLPSHGLNIPKHIPPLQRALLENVLPTWGPTLDLEKSFDLVQQYFSPSLFMTASAGAKEIAVHAYATILSIPLTEYSIRLLVHLTKTYPIDVLWLIVGHGKRSSAAGRNSVTWDDCVRDICAIPAKVSNALGERRSSIPPELEYGPYFNNVSTRCELLIASLPASPNQDELASVTYLFTKLVNIGLFPASVPPLPAQPSFFRSTLQTIRGRLHASPEYASAWQHLLGSLPSTLMLQAMLVSLFSHLPDVPDLDASPVARASAKREAITLKGMLGRLGKESEILDGFTIAALGRTWNVGLARTLVCWIAGAESGRLNVDGIEILLQKVIDIWATPDHVRHSLLSGHQYYTALLLLTVSYLARETCTSNPNASKPAAVASLAMSPAFVRSIGTYISHIDPSVRRCGMLVAEEVARLAGKELDFGDWEGDKEGRAWCRQIRELTRGRDTDADVDILVAQSADAPPQEQDSNAGTEAGDRVQDGVSTDSKSTSRRPVIETLASGYDSDDSVTGYVSEPSSSRSPSPTPSELDEIEKDPTLRVSQTKIARPVYLAQLGEMIRPTTGVRTQDDQDAPKRIEVALDVAEELIRRKRAYGSELEENAVNLVYGLVGINNSYELDGFDEKRQAALTALVACCPHKAAPSIIEEFFKNMYSTDQRFVMLNALALGARELAGLPLPPNASKASAERVSFPSKRLPPSMHQKYLSLADELSSNGPVQALLEGISQKAIESGRDAAETKVPAYARERQLRMKPTSKIAEVSDRLQSMHLQTRPAVAFTDVAAEHFICPMINRFWLFLRDEQTREERSAHQEPMHRYRSAGTGLILHALVLSHFVATLAVLVHAAHNAKEWLAIVAPDALELAVTVGTRPVSREEGVENSGDEENPAEQHAKKEAAVLTASLELALVVVDGCLETDGGKSLGLEHTALLLATGEWAEEVLSRLDKGVKMLGGGGLQEMKLQRAAAGLMLKVDELKTRWRRSMVAVGA